MKDLKQQADGDIDLSTGDTQWVDGKYQHIKDCLRTDKGQMKSNLADGLDLEQFINDDSAGNMIASIRSELIKDGVKNLVVVYDGKGGLNIDGDYEEN